MESLLDFLKFKIKFKKVVPPVQQKKKKKRCPSLTSLSTTPTEPQPTGPSQKRARTKSADVGTIKPVAVSHPEDDPRTSPVTLKAKPMAEAQTVVPPPIDPAELAPTVAGPPVNLLENMTNTLSSRGMRLQIADPNEMIHPAFRPLTDAQSQLLKELEELEPPEMPEPITGFVCPFCSEPLPGPHLAELQKSYKWYQKKSKGFTKQLCWTVTGNYCELHQKEFKLIPQAHARGWPKEIDWPGLPTSNYKTGDGEKRDERKKKKTRKNR
ncbi:hypothetical protein Pst134EA_026847 [Puccinia striiformis f. sp. tritici]|uniref:Uncharacterized protein n=2 Tax=Puccinia striiformis f. sp. tritici PST-78 TaxID=1165861 RepID=A0A0L0W3H0_9BASI|nr:hypothetical protein Pst134EA_026847 [Puccinia striiformis f. sp. tritici]KAH9450138.1 hypothetical protein Pst134EA_026847 [Puccinia striiformis f. sp. tritici]KNF06056.1 hypothetical protein PSTG_00571 [Puccinia striiformis f. sp. tritici PST-78]